MSLDEIAGLKTQVAAALDAAEAQPGIFSGVERERALAQAEDVAARDHKGPLAGMILAHKDMYDRAGQVTGMGAHSSAGYTADKTCTVLQRLDDAGQVDIGRLRMSEFAMGPTGHNAHYGVAPNACVPGAVPGGSSSGSGAVVSAGIVRAALGSDTGGSIRIPAAFCGVVGFKPTQGRVPVTGVMPLSFSQDTVGPLAASVAEARLVLSVISGADGIDPVCPDRPVPRPMAEALPAGVRVAFDDSAFTAPASDAVLAGLARVREAISGLGATTRTMDLGLLHTLGEPANVIAMSEAAAVHANRLSVAAETYGPQIRARLAQAAAIPGFAYVRAQQIRAEAQRVFREHVFAAADLLILPTAPDVAPMAEAVDLGNDPAVASLIGRIAHFTRPINLLGLPALSLPVLRTPDGPISVQIVGPAWSEDLIADLAQALETTLAL